ncbi:DUF397 domain-containing protein [Spirillospora sp. NPDC048819]|uniref:DUF397 domain-containing protein n=1 Tax=Spirillospora sp. NPDC048819 TaxID=3155268 RepID=UPI0033EAC18F
MTKPAPYALRWRKATASQGSQGCVELAPLAGGLVVRDSKNPDGPTLLFGRSAWCELTDRVNRGEFDL